MKKEDEIDNDKKEIYEQETLSFIEEDEDDRPSSLLSGVTITRSNAFIMAKYKTSLLEKKLVMLAMTRIEENENGELFAKIYASELKSIMSLRRDSIYTQLKEMSQSVIHHSFFIEDKDEKKFLSFNLCPAAEYDDGTFTLYFSSHIKRYVGRLSRDFTTLPVLPFMNAKSGYTFRLYEIFMTKKYLMKDKKGMTWRISLSELKLLLGCCDLDNDAIQKALRKGMTYDQIVNDVAKEKIYNRWADFSKRVLDCAQKELDKSTDKELKFTYSPVRMGRGGKVVAVDFYIYWNENYNPEYVTVRVDSMKKKKDRKEEELQKKNARDAVIYYMQQNIPEPFTRKEMSTLAKSANYDTDLIQRTYDLAKEQAYISNLFAWLNKGLQERWADNKPIESWKNRSYDEGIFLSEEYNAYKNATEEEKKEALAEYAKRKSENHQYSMKFDEEDGVRYEMDAPEPNNDFVAISREEYELFKKMAEEREEQKK